MRAGLSMLLVVGFQRHNIEFFHIPQTMASETEWIMLEFRLKRENNGINQVYKQIDERWQNTGTYSYGLLCYILFQISVILVKMLCIHRILQLRHIWNILDIIL